MADMSDESEFDNQTLGYLMYRASLVLQPAVNAALRPLGLTLPDVVCMKILAASPGMSNAELARATNVTPQSMNAILKRLQDMGAVTRPASVSSGRALPAQLTREGKTLLKRGEAAGEAAEAQVLAELTPTQRRQVKRLLGIIGASATVFPAEGTRASSNRS
jgi:DNA-binding MarR family transcriptional regulator